MELAPSFAIQIPALHTDIDCSDIRASMAPKESLRQKMRHVLRDIAAPSLLTYSNRVETLFYCQEFFTRGLNFGIYSSIRDKEINTDPIIRQLLFHKKNVFIPSWKKGAIMDMVRIRDWDDYMSIPVDRSGIRRPLDSSSREKGLAFDPTGHRLGRGQGYYDSYITAYKKYSKENTTPFPVLVGFALPEQIVPYGELPTNILDQQLDYILVGDGSVYPSKANDKLFDDQASCEASGFMAVIKTALEEHASFFDLDGNGVIVPWETFTVLYQELCLPLWQCLPLTLMFHAYFSYPTLPTWVPDPFFSIHICRIDKCQIGSHTGIFSPYNDETVLLPSKATRGIDLESFESHFGPLSHEGIIHAKRLQDCVIKDEYFEELDFKSLLRYVVFRNFKCRDIFGWIISTIIWSVLYATNEKPLTKREIIDFYSGKLFPETSERKKKYL